MINLFLISIAPVVMILMYIYYRDKHEKEPIHMLILSVIMGAIAVVPIIIIELILSIPSSWMSNYMQAGWDAFVVAATTEEFFKFLVFMLFIWRNKHFNEAFDGIVYAVYISLGFALVENIMYVSDGGTSTALLRAITAVPAHAIFGVTMGFYLGLAKYKPQNRKTLLTAALIMPILLHGVYDFIIMANLNWLLVAFIPYLIVLYIWGLKRIKQLSIISGEQLKKENISTSQRTYNSALDNYLATEKINMFLENNEADSLNINDLNINNDDTDKFENNDLGHTKESNDFKRGFGA